MAGFDELSSRYGNKLYVIAYGEFLKLGITNSPLKRVKSIIDTFGNGVDLSESCYYHMPENLANVIELKIKKEFDKYEGVEKYKTECFNIEDMDDILARIEELTEPFGDDIEKVDLNKEVSVIVSAVSGEPIVRDSRHLYSVYKLFMENREAFDELFLDRLERERLEKSEDKRM